MLVQFHVHSRYLKFSPSASCLSNYASPIITEIINKSQNASQQIFYLFHFDQETINEVPRIVHVQCFLVFFYFLQNIIFYIGKISKYLVMTSREIINYGRKSIADLED